MRVQAGIVGIDEVFTKPASRRPAKGAARVHQARRPGFIAPGSARIGTLGA